jgi:hypothetical protein
VLRPTKQPINECRFCAWRSCYARIVAIGFDEVACKAHTRELELFADAILPVGWRRISSSGTDKQRRGAYDLRSWREHIEIVTVEQAPGDPPYTLMRSSSNDDTPRPPVLSESEIGVMRHALGITVRHDGTERGYDYRANRNYYATSEDNELWRGLAIRGLAKRLRPHDERILPGATFAVTRRGRVLVGAPLINERGNLVDDDDAVF